MAKPIYKQIPGVTGATHAEREGRYEAANLAYRRRTCSCTTEMQGTIIAYLDPIRWMPELVGYGQAGDVVRWSPGTRVMNLSEPADFSHGDLYLTLIRDDGSLTIPVPVTPYTTAYDIKLPAVPDFSVVFDDGDRERTKYLLGNLTTGDELVKVSAIIDGGKSEDGAQLFDIQAVIDDDRVHLADNALLPAGIEQDPVDPGVEVDDVDTIALVTLQSHDIYVGSPSLGGGHSIAVTLYNDGTMSLSPDGVEAPVLNEWLLVPVEVVRAAAFEVFASSYNASAFSGSAFDTWLSMDTTRSWTLGEYDRVPVQLRLQIREIATGLVQADKVIYMQVNVTDLSTGGS